MTLDDDGNSSSSTNQHRQPRSMQVVMFVTLFVVLLDFLSDFVFLPKDAPAGVIGKEQQMQHLQQQELELQQQYQEQCISLADDGNLDRMLAEVDLVYLAMPPKTGSMTVGHFKAECLGLDFDNSQLDHLEKLIKDERDIPAFITQRIHEPKSLIKVVKQSVTNSLIIYFYRDETERLGSAIRQVVVRKLDLDLSKNNRVDQSKIILNVSEEDLLHYIQKGSGEIGQSGTSLLTCDTYHAIEDSAPNFVFLHYTQSDRLTRLLAKNHCPGTTVESNNIGAFKPTVMVNSKKWKNPMDLNDWMAANLNMLEHHFELKPKKFCQAETRRMTHNLLACPDQGLHYSSADFYTPADTLIAKKPLPP